MKNILKSNLCLAMMLLHNKAPYYLKKIMVSRFTTLQNSNVVIQYVYLSLDASIQMFRLCPTDDEMFDQLKCETHRPVDPLQRQESRGVENPNKRRWSTESGDNQKLVTSSKVHKLQRRVSEAEGWCMRDFKRFHKSYTLSRAG